MSAAASCVGDRGGAAAYANRLPRLWASFVQQKRNLRQTDGPHGRCRKVRGSPCVALEPATH